MSGLLLVAFCLASVSYGQETESDEDWATTVARGVVEAEFAADEMEGLAEDPDRPVVPEQFEVELAALGLRFQRDDRGASRRWDRRRRRAGHESATTFARLGSASRLLCCPCGWSAGSCGEL